MARISTYGVETSLQNDDKFLGTDGSTGATKNFYPQTIAKFLNETAAIGVARQTSLRFTTETDPTLWTYGHMFLTDHGVDMNMAQDISMTVNKYNFNIERHLALFNYAVGKRFYIFSFNDPETFVLYNVISIEQNEDHQDFYNLVLEYSEGTGTFEDTTVYGLAVEPNTSDKTYSTGSTFHNSSAEWVITHNLGKKPSVTILKYGTEEEVYANVVHNSENKLTITFAQPFAGTAILN
jgi:hypothetical protein